MSRVNEDSYNKIAESFSIDRSLVRVDEEVVSFGDLFESGSRILSVGCGSGIPNEKYLAENGFKITGVDVSEKLLEKAKKNIPSGIFVQEDIINYESPEQFDGILAWWSLFHLKPFEQKIVFKKLYDLLADGGYLLFNHGAEVSEGEITGEMYGSEFYYSCPGLKNLENILDELHFSIIEWSVYKEDGNNHMVALVKKT